MKTRSNRSPLTINTTKAGLCLLHMKLSHAATHPKTPSHSAKKSTFFSLQESWVLLDDTFLSFSLPQVELSHNFITSYSRKLILKIFGCHSWILAISLSLKDMNYNLNSQVCIAITKVEFTILQLFAPPDDELSHLQGDFFFLFFRFVVSSCQDSSMIHCVQHMKLNFAVWDTKFHTFILTV